MILKIDEIKIADEIETMLKNDIFTDEKYIIRRDGRSLIPKERNLEQHDIQLFVDEGPNSKSKNLANVDALVLNKESKIIEMIIEYELDTNPKNLTGNFITSFIVDYYESKFSNDFSTIYKLDSNKTLVYLITCLPRKRKLSAREQAPLNKGNILKERLIKIKELIKGHSSVFEGDIIIGDDIEQIKKETKNSILKFYKK